MMRIHNKLVYVTPRARLRSIKIKQLSIGRGILRLSRGRRINKSHYHAAISRGVSQ